MFFDKYKLHKDAKVRPSLLWEYDLSRFDWELMSTIVVQRVVERGRMDDFYAILNMYGLDGVRENIKKIPSLSPKDMNFVCAIFGIDKNELRCYTKIPSDQRHWNS